MTVKALCGVFYNGKLYRAGEMFSVDAPLPNTKRIIVNEPPSAESTSDPPSAPDLGEKPKKRR